MGVWVYEIYANKNDQVACCKIAVKSETVEEASKLAKDFSMQPNNNLHPDPRIERLDSEQKNDNILFGKGEQVRLLEY